MTSAIGEAPLEQAIPLESLEGKLTGRVVRQILTQTNTDLASEIITKRWRCVSYLGIYDWSEKKYDYVPKVNRVFFCVILPISIYASIATAFSLLAKADYDSDMHFSLALIPAVMTVMMSVFHGVMYISGDDPGMLHERCAVYRINKKRLYIAEHLQAVKESDYCLPTYQIATIISQVEFKIAPRILSAASIKEFGEIVEECGRRRITLSQLSQSQTALQKLIQNPPGDVNRFGELFVWASEALKDEKDLEELRSLFDVADPRLAVFNTLIFGEVSASEAPQVVAIDIPQVENESISINNEKIDVDKELLMQKSSWFRVHAQGQFKKNANVSYLFPEHLKVILKNLNREFWLGFKRDKDSLLELFECMTYYQFDEMVMKFGLYLFQRQFLSAEEEIRVAGSISAIRDLPRSVSCTLERTIFDRMIQSNISEEDCEAWFDYALAQFPDELINMFYAYLIRGEFGNRISPFALKAMIHNEQQFSAVMGMITSRVFNLLHTHSVDMTPFKEDFVFYDWLEKRQGTLISEGNFKQLWYASHADKVLKKLLLKYAYSQKKKIIQLWPVGTAPASLIEGLNFF